MERADGEDENEVPIIIERLHNCTLKKIRLWSLYLYRLG